MTHHGVEIEIKLAVRDAETAAGRVLSAGFTQSVPRLFEVNVVFDTEDGGLRGKGELLRLRTVGGRNILTWKGAPVQGRHKTRPETEVEFSDFEALEGVFRHLGYSPVFRYEKYRTEFRGPDETGSITLDETPIGCYLELEGDASWIDAVAQKLGFSEADYITQSYGSLYLSHCRRAGIKPAWMVF
jgi:adenylate cyclase class 2